MKPLLRFGLSRVAALLLISAPLTAQPDVDYQKEIQPIFNRSCSGGFCHIGVRTSGVDLSTYQAVVGSVGEGYTTEIVVPFNSSASPIMDKLTSDFPEIGQMMPFGGPPLPQGEIDLIARWIDEGARERAVTLIRGDADGSGSANISDAIYILAYLYSGGQPPPCAPLADVSADGRVNISDVLFLLNHLFGDGPEPTALSAAEANACAPANRPPEVEPIGTVQGREGVPIEFAVVASDPDADNLLYEIESGPAGLGIDASGVATWTPRIGDAGDHRIRVRVTDDGAPPESVVTTGLVRVLEGNNPPELEELGTVYGREGVLLSFHCQATDVDSELLRYDIVTAPAAATYDAETGLFEWTPAIGEAGEYPIVLRATDDGEPPQSDETSITIIIVAADSPVNQPPFVPASGVYRTYPGQPVALAAGASDPDGNALRYAAESLPDGATFGESDGTLRWTPAADQIGPFYVPFTVTDDGVPPAVSEGILVLRVAPLDPCTTIDCDPATGCEDTLAPLEESCCAEEPTERAAEPVAGCPEGRILHVGRNFVGFGRLQNCDRLRVTPFGQGGSNVRLNVEARCVDPEVIISARLETPDYVLFDEQSIRTLQVRNDGYAQALAIFFPVRFGIPTSAFRDAQALLTVSLTDADGVVLERKLRLVLTTDFLFDLPEPDVVDIPAGEVGCVGCHRPLGPTGERDGIEDAHPWYPLTCTDCHGGNPTAATRLDAHVQPVGPFGQVVPSFLRNLSIDELNAVPSSYIQFVNPGDLRVAARGCGAQNPANPGTGCHQQFVASVPMSVMATYAGHYDLPRYLAGSQPREASIFAAVDISDPEFDPLTAPVGATASFQALREPDPVANRADIGTCIDVYLPKSCPTCHLSDFGPNNSAGNYRSSGCTACHMLYDEDGLSLSADPMISKNFPPHPKKHALTKAIPTEQCTHCHFQGGRIGLSYRGIREGGFSEDQTPANGVTLGRELHAHDRDYYFVDEDDTNDVDETPPDLHHDAGMVCVDCHVGGDVHGDGNMYVSERYQVGVRCEDCHGTVRAEIAADPEDGLFKTSKGFPLRRVRRAGDDRILLKLAAEDREIEIPQIHRVIADGINHAMIEAMGVNENGFSHTDSLECYTCHTSWRPTCFGCHVTIDDRASARNKTTGRDSLGAINVTRDTYSLDFFALGLNERGKISPLCSSMSIFMTYIDENGETHYTDRIRTSADGRKGFGWNPFHHHTVSRVPQNCDVCHPTRPDVGDDNTETLRQTYGFGNGRTIVEDGDGVAHDLSAFLDESGELTSDFPHPNTGPVPAEARERALSIEVVPHPRQR